MSYENAKSTKLVATHCAACGRPLVDASSVEAGIGPICRKKYQYEDALPITDEVESKVKATLSSVPDQDLQGKIGEAVNKDDSRRAANLLVHHIAHHQKGPESMGAIRLIRAFGYNVLADRIEDRLKPQIRVKIEEGRIIVDSPYNETFVSAIREIEGRKFDFETKTWNVPVAQKRTLWDALRAGYEGEVAQGPKGPFVL